MNTQTLVRLAWKELRSIRLFWISIVALVFLMLWLTTTFTSESLADLTVYIFHFALAAPVLFAAGCAGASFAAEREEGTFDFLRASPVSSREVFTSKLGMTILATAAMFPLLWLLAMRFTHDRLPESDMLQAMLGLWLIGALEVIAWGTLFSLLLARPLAAVVLAMLAASICAHLLASFYGISSAGHFQFSSYAKVAIARIVLVAGVLLLDTALGLNWLHGRQPRQAKIKTAPAADILPTDEAKMQESLLAARLLARRDRFQMLNRLLWQHFRQSWRLMLLMPLVVLLIVAMNYPVVNDGSWGMLVRQFSSLTLLFTTAFGAISGALVFLSDQERRNFRFFVEHNVPPGYVWFSRQLPWMSMICLTMSAMVIFFKRALFGVETWGSSYPLAIILLSLAVSYSIGQWTSMHIRSGIISAFCALVLSGLTCAWIFLMVRLQVDFSFSVLPIPLVLLFATWLRAKHWITENTTWRASIRAAAVVLIPVAAMFAGVAMFRVEQIPPVSPGFIPATFMATVQQQLNDGGQVTADLYRQACEAYVHPEKELDNRRPFNDEQKKWLDDNAKLIDLALAASKRPNCVFSDPATATELPELRMIGGVIGVLEGSGHQLESEGKLDEALDRYFTALKVIDQTAPAAGGPASLHQAEQIFTELTQWAALKGQTPNKILNCISKLQAIQPDMLHGDEWLKTANLVVRRSILAGDANRPLLLLDGDSKTQLEHDRKYMSDVIWGRLMPWENRRAVRALNVITAGSLMISDTIRKLLADQNSRIYSPEGTPGMPWMAGYRNSSNIPVDLPTNPSSPGPNERAVAEYQKLATSVPDPGWMDTFGMANVQELIEFEACRRGTLIVLGLEVHRLEFGKLPESLDELEDNLTNRFRLSLGLSLSPFISNRFPVDPYSGTAFRYFPSGVPIPWRPKYGNAAPQPGHANGAEFATGTPSSTYELKGAQISAPPIVRGAPGIWCCGPRLRGREIDRSVGVAADSPIQFGLPDAAAAAPGAVSEPPKSDPTVSAIQSVLHFFHQAFAAEPAAEKNGHGASENQTEKQYEYNYESPDGKTLNTFSDDQFLPIAGEGFWFPIPPEEK